MKTKVRLDNNTQAFFELVRAGLFPVHGEGVMVNGSFFEGVDWSEVYRMAEEQSVIGLIADAIDRIKFQVSGFRIPQAVALQFVGQTLQIEQRNKAMNAFVAELIELLRKNDVYALLVKGQGIAQCYEKSLWRACGDVDLLLSEENYEKARRLLEPLASSVEDENIYTRHLGMIIDGWEVELHGNLRSELSRRIDRGLDEITKDVFYGGNVRSWMNGRTQVFLMGANDDVVYVFTHILQHFFRGGIGLRQVCDWCRLMWTYRDKLNYGLLESRIRKMGLMTEWKVFYNLASRCLGMPDEFQVSCSMFQVDSRFDKKADRVMELILESGNFGHNRDESYRQRYSGFKKRAIPVWRYTQEGLQHFRIFSMDSLRVWCRQMKTGLWVAIKR